MAFPHSVLNKRPASPFLEDGLPPASKKQRVESNTIFSLILPTVIQKTFDIDKITASYIRQTCKALSRIYLPHLIDLPLDVLNTIALQALKVEGLLRRTCKLFNNHITVTTPLEEKQLNQFFKYYDDYCVHLDVKMLGRYEEKLTKQLAVRIREINVDAFLDEDNTQNPNQWLNPSSYAQFMRLMVLVGKINSCECLNFLMCNYPALSAFWNIDYDKVNFKLPHTTHLRLALKDYWGAYGEEELNLGSFNGLFFPLRRVQSCKHFTLTFCRFNWPLDCLALPKNAHESFKNHFDQNLNSREEMDIDDAIIGYYPLIKGFVKGQLQTVTLQFEHFHLDSQTINTYCKNLKDQLELFLPQKFTYQWGEKIYINQNELHYSCNYKTGKQEPSHQASYIITKIN